MTRLFSKTVPLLMLLALLQVSACSSGKHLDAGADNPAAGATKTNTALKPDETVTAPSVNTPQTQTVTTTTTIKPEEAMHFRLLNLEKQMTDLQGDVNKLIAPIHDLAAKGKALDETASQIEARQKALSAQKQVESAPDVLVPASDNSADKAGSQAAADTKPLAVAPPPPAMSALEAEEQKAQNQAQPVLPSGPAETTPAQAHENPAVQTSDSPAPAAAPAATNITGLRVGQHGNAARLVLDVAAPVKFKYDIDNKEKLLTVQLSAAAWTAPAQENLKNPLVKSYTSQKNAADASVTLVITLARPARVSSALSLAPDKDYGNRIVFDIVAL